jgi:putative nucleotidyltransferase with HDIG domain
MDRINKIYNSSMYRQELVYIVEDEKDRVYCKHDIEHFLDVARIAYIINLEKNLGYSKDIIYAIALLHDIGRHREYKEGINHHMASAEIAKFILKNADYMPNEIKIIEEAILHHRNKTNMNRLNELIYMADKVSRKCFSCSAIETCKWSNSKKNKEIMY